MTDPLDLDAIRAREQAATPGPWFYNSYAMVQAAALLLAWEAADAEADYPEEPRPGGRNGHPFFDEADNAWLAHRDRAYELDIEVASVPPHHGDTATGRHAADAEFIAHARQDVPALLARIAELEQQYANLYNATRALCALVDATIPSMMMTPDEQNNAYGILVQMKAALEPGATVAEARAG